ncbi:MAG: glycosyltransferase [Thermoplasmatales archaeon]
MVGANDTKISVIVTAHNRKEYILEALASLASQTLDRKYYEVIVVKNYNDEKIDRQIESYQFKNIFCNETPVGAKLKRAILNSEGNVIAFLEDDDLFLKDKLKVVFSYFSSEQNLFIFRNCGEFIDKNSKTYGIYTRDAFEKIRKFTWPDNFKGRDLRNLKFAIDFNLGLMAVRKEALINKLAFLEMIVRSPDIFVFFASLSEGKDIIIDGTVLTLIRRHGNEASMTFGSFQEVDKKRIQILEITQGDKIATAHSLSDKFAVDAFWNLFFWVKIERILREKASKRSVMFMEGRSYLRLKFEAFHIIPPFFALIYTAFLVSPFLSRTIFKIFEWLRFSRHSKVFNMS